MKNYELELSPRDISNYIKRLNDFKQRIPQIKEKILNELAEYARERMIYYIDTSVNQQYATGKLSDSIFIELISESEIKVYVDSEMCPYAMYVEYGTGIIGEGTHPDYNGSYKNEGWWYPTTADDPNPNKKQLKSGEWVVYTQGQVAHKFTYNAYQDLRKKYKWIVLKTLKEEGYI